MQIKKLHMMNLSKLLNHNKLPLPLTPAQVPQELKKKREPHHHLERVDMKEAHQEGVQV